jgi:hypothetical protein
MPEVAMETAFLWINTLVLPFWLLLLAAPRWRVTQVLIRYQVGPVLLAVAYAWVVVPLIPQILPTFASTPQLEPIRQMLATPTGTYLVWAHLLCFDLLAGTWVCQQALTQQAHPAIRVGSLLLCFLFGPLGLLVYLASAGWWASPTKQD